MNSICIWYEAHSCCRIRMLKLAAHAKRAVSGACRFVDQLKLNAHKQAHTNKSKKCICIAIVSVAHASKWLARLLTKRTLLE